MIRRARGKMIQVSIAIITKTLAQSQEIKNITMTSTLSRNTFNDEDQSVEGEALSAYHGEAQEARGEKSKTEMDVQQLYDEPDELTMATGHSVFRFLV
jgi:hypothetical protein